MGALFGLEWFGYPAYFSDAKFCGLAVFDGATFSGEAEFGGATFSGDARFRGAMFERTADFDRIQYNADALFQSVHFAADAGFDSSRFAPGCNILFYTSHPRSFRRPRYGESAYRFAKQAAQARGDYTEAGRYHYAEQCAIENRLMHGAGVELRLEGLARLLFGRVVFGYGERPSHPLFVGLAVILIWANLYAHYQAVAPGHVTDPAAVEAYRTTDFLQALHFSVVTFTTLGYGDFKPKPPYRLLADIEAVLGAALLATFVVCLTRKYMR